LLKEALRLHLAVLQLQHRALLLQCSCCCHASRMVVSTRATVVGITQQGGCSRCAKACPLSGA
jgi:hypothetical protein